MENAEIPDEKILPLDTAETTAWPETNFLISLLKTIPCGWEWILNSHIQLRGAHFINYRWNILDFRITFYPYGMHDLTPNIYEQCPFIDKYTVPRKLINIEFLKFSDFVEYAVSNNYYISTYFDQFFRKDINVPGYHHPAYIYGYDKKKKLVYMMDNFEMGKYASKEISYDELEFAYRLIEDKQWEASIFLYQLKPYVYEFCPKFVEEQIDDYLYPGKGVCYLNRMMCPNQHYNGAEYSNDVYFGIDCYHLLHRYLKAVLTGDTRYPVGDVRSFCMIEDHKSLMISRYQFMVEKGYMQADENLQCLLEEQLKSSKILSNLFLKGMIKEETKIFERIDNRLCQFIENEKRCMQLFQKNIAKRNK